MLRRRVGLLALFMAASISLGQGPGRTLPPQFQSPEVSADRKVSLRIHAPKATLVKISSGDMTIAGDAFKTEMKKNEQGVWEATVGPVPAGAYRYHFDVDGVSVVDPRNPKTSESNSNTWSLVTVPGEAAYDTQNVPHGAVAAVTYHSKTLDRFRRMHVYTPPGYEKSTESYPVFYLLHGAMDSDNSWSTVGRAGVILDNLIASKKAKPMIVVMPHGHTAAFRMGPPARGERSFDKQMEDFVNDFNNDIRPTVEKTYRVLAGRENRAIAGLSMGGAQTLNIAFGKGDEYAYVGVFSSGIFGIAGGFGGQPPSTAWEDSHKKILDDAEMRKGMKLLWFLCGEKDFLVQTSNASVEMFKKHQFDVQRHDSPGGHTWDEWRAHLVLFAEKLFQ